MKKQSLALEPQGVESLFIDAFFLQIWENRRIFFTNVSVWYLNNSQVGYCISKGTQR